MFALTVTFDLVPGHADAFLEHMHVNAVACRSDEPGCRRFDVCHDPERPERVFLYELYDDAAAFDAHLTAPHFKAFDAAVRDLVVSRTIATFPEVWT